MSTPATIPQDRVRIFGPGGSVRAEFRTSVSRSSVISDEGRAQFTYPSRKTNVVNENVLQYGNWILIENSQLDPWVGIIDVPREWDARNVTVSAYTPERMFSFRRGPIEQVENGSPGNIFEVLINRINNQQATILRLGDTWKGGTPMQETLNPTLLSEDLRRIQERSQEEYMFRPVMDASGKLTVYADWKSRIGETTPLVLQEGKGGGNMESVGRILVEDGPIVNDILGYGDGETWISKPTSQVVDVPSINKFGLRQEAKEFDGVTAVQTLTDNSNQRLKVMRNTLKTFKINAINRGDTFKYLHIGNIVTVIFQNIGFFSVGGLGYKTTVRIVGTSYDPQMKNKLSLVVEELLP